MVKVFLKFWEMSINELAIIILNIISDFFSFRMIKVYVYLSLWRKYIFWITYTWTFLRLLNCTVNAKKAMNTRNLLYLTSNDQESLIKNPFHCHCQWRCQRCSCEKSRVLRFYLIPPPQIKPFIVFWKNKLREYFIKNVEKECTGSQTRENY